LIIIAESPPQGIEYRIHLGNGGLYKALVSTGVEETKAKKIAEDVITRDDANNLASKVDIAEIKTEISALETRLYRAIAVQTVAIVGAVLLVPC